MCWWGTLIRSQISAYSNVWSWHQTKHIQKLRKICSQFTLLTFILFKFTNNAQCLRELVLEPIDLEFFFPRNVLPCFLSLYKKTQISRMFLDECFEDMSLYASKLLPIKLVLDPSTRFILKQHGIKLSWLQYQKDSETLSLLVWEHFFGYSELALVLFKS